MQAEARSRERPAVEQHGEVRRDGAQAIAALERDGAMPLGEQRDAMLGLLDDLALAVRAVVACDALAAGEHADLEVVGDERQRALGVLRRDRVAIGVEAHEGLAIDDNRRDALGRGPSAGQREQPRSLLGEHVGDRALRLHRMWPRVRDLGDEAGELRIALGEARERAPREKSIAHVTNGALDLALVLGSRHRAQAGLYAHLGAEIVERRMKADRVAAALEHDGLGIIEEPLPRHAAERVAGAHQRTTQRVHRQVEHELAPHRARVRQHEHEQPQRALAARHRDLADVRPVDLRLLARQRLGAQVHLALRPGAHLGDVFAERPHRAAIATLGQHVVEPRRAQSWIARQRLGDEVAIRPDEARSRQGIAALWIATDRAADDIGMDTELRGDRADAPVLGEVQPHDLGFERWRAHRAPRRSSFCRSRNGPSARVRRRGSTTSTS